MPKKLRERGLGLTMLFSMAMVTVLPAWSQAQTQTQTPTPTHSIQPTLNVQALATSNSELARGSSATGKKELVISVTPGIGFAFKGAQSELVGQFQLEGLRYVRATQPDRFLPSGDVRLKLEPVKDAVGVDATLRAAQVRASTTAQQVSPGNTANTYTDTTVHVAPYLRGRLDTNTMAEIRLDRGVLNRTQFTPPPPSSPADVSQGDAFTSEDRVRVLRKPTPMGYEVELLDKSQRYKGNAEPALAQREGSVAMLLAPDPELTVGFKVLRARLRQQGNELTDTSLGYQTQWRPTSRSMFQFETENRSYGRTWLADLQHRWRWVSAGIRAERLPTSYALEASRRGAGAQEPTQPFDTGAQLRQAIQGRMIVMGRRNQMNLAAGLVKSASLFVSSSGDVTTGGRKSREHYFETELTHQLTPANSLTGGLRWARTWVTQAQTGESVLSRDFVMRAAINTKLTPDTTATMGLKRQITHNTQTTSANETAGYVGLGHRF